MVADYIKETGNHVLYRVTPVFEGNTLVASGILMEAYSVEDSGRGVCFCIFAYNVQPGVSIDYFSGVNVLSGEALPEITPPSQGGGQSPGESDNGEIMSYVLNTNSKKFHTPGKSCADSISEKNRADYTGTRNSLIYDGYSPCGICKP